MPDDPNAPADTTMMRIVHAALRRDLRRARTALGADPAPDHRQCAAIAEHLHWMMGFLEARADEPVNAFPIEGGVTLASADAHLHVHLTILGLVPRFCVMCPSKRASSRGKSSR